jgi:hypothetical protein
MSKNINDTLGRFLNDGVIWEILSNLQDACGTRFGAYAKLIELTQSRDADALDNLTLDKGQALWLACQLVGEDVFCNTMVEAIRSAIDIDCEEDITTAEAAMLQKLLKVSIS